MRNVVFGTVKSLSVFWGLKPEVGLPEGVEVGVVNPDGGNSKLETDENLIGLGGGIFWILVVGDWGFSIGGSGGVNLGHSGISSGKVVDI